ncbi:MAG: organomercurial lyase MerB [Actinomycetota bacterium]|nr:organomercurial lyase MerB [Actinomycetota bacterium]
MDSQAQQLATRLTAVFNGGGAASARPWLWRPLLQLLAQGQRVTVEQIAQATGKTVTQVREALAANPDTEYDEHGRITGSGLTQNPTPHRFEVDGRTLYTWCAMDALIFPAVLDHPAHMTSPCRATGTPVRLTVEPGQVTSVEPATAVVSIVAPETPASIRAAFCNQVHFFATPDAAKDWLDQHPGATVLPVADAYQLGQPLTEALLAGDTLQLPLNRTAGGRCNETARPRPEAARLF